ncbi:hypothetical protein FHX82_002449 [Amycolatopsis bartoniae]|uniref:Uncharacterized protein n=1 Tax=Amycolatopsis bartoniae TaxID=941986 RepID=A0A8H9J2B8_9PSEU|nr:DUF6480 family protein [Amycolatopsis bartoniae]MBB2935395.1 hypothetical protein [Amycolatopsis bartoniae]TVT03734.1 hypothetical protein FNH07_25155 [Amycolatopsis bartoniae]GHF75777.1 hypothetical protein GCM10017566_57000 [Amycolatopsis bartoniae]
MTRSSNPDPDPDNTPGLEPGGGVQPGDTPPDSGSTTLGLSNREPHQPRSVPWITIVIAVILALLIAALVVSSAVGWLHF